MELVVAIEIVRGGLSAGFKFDPSAATAAAAGAQTKPGLGDFGVLDVCRRVMAAPGQHEGIFLRLFGVSRATTASSRGEGTGDDAFA